MRPQLIVAAIVLFGILVGSIVYVYFALPREQTDISLGTSGGAPERPKTPEVHIYKKSPRLLLITWSALPAGTRAVEIFRSPKGKTAWAKWKTVPVAPGGEGGGSIDLIFSASENLNLYSFYVQAVAPTTAGPSTSSGQGGGGGTGAVLWTSSSTPIEPYVPPPTPAPTSTTSGDSGTPPPGTSTTTSPTPTSSPSQTPSPTPTGTPQDPNQIIYYTPSGEISGSSTLQTAEAFWVQHVDKKIEVGWQNIAIGLDTAVVYRSTSDSGPWSELLRQTTPPSSYVIRLIDDTLGQARYYRMITYAGGAQIKVYGPVYLPGLTSP